MITPLTPIPPAWADQGHCPLCGASPLQAASDHLICPHCGTALEEEAGGPRLRLVHLPAALHAEPDGVWRSAADTRAWARGLLQAAQAIRPTPPAAPPCAEVPPPAADPAPAAADPAPAPAEALARAQQLLSLRHTPAQIQVILERSPEWTPAQIHAGLAARQALDAQARARQGRALRLSLSVGLGLTLLLAVVVALAWPRAAPDPTSAAGPQPTSALAGAPTVVVSNLPVALQTLLPPGVQLINPTPVIRRGASAGPTTGAPGVSANAPTACPVTAAAAADLFGGEVKAWRYDDTTRGWMMFTPELVTVRVPAGMVAGYMEIGQSLNMTQVAGPAEISGVNMLVISCE